MAATLGVIAAPAGVKVEEFAGDIGEIHDAVILILEFLQAAQPATIAQGFPLLGAELLEALASPERQGVVTGHVVILPAPR
jgi:hypothetical protein